MLQRCRRDRKIELADRLATIEQPSVFLSESSSDLFRERKDDHPGEKSTKAFCRLRGVPGAMDAGDEFSERDGANG